MPGVTTNYIFRQSPDPVEPSLIERLSIFPALHELTDISRYQAFPCDCQGERCWLKEAFGVPDLPWDEMPVVDQVHHKQIHP
ncbi:hypothetical protein [Streptosporangium sp. NPDC003464]